MFVIFPPRCNKCLSKVYCSEECWEAGHKGFCSEAVDKRKVKQTGKKRRQAGKDYVKKDLEKIRESSKDTEEGRETIKVITKLCKELGRSKKTKVAAKK